jgi:conjugal transfer pilus assembly protein TraV
LKSRKSKNKRGSLMRLVIRISLLMAVTSLFAGCSVFGIYDSEFACPNTYNGRCISLDGAHTLSKEGKDGPQYDPDVKKKKKSSDDETEAVRQPNAEESAQSQYKESLYKRLDSLVKEPRTPVVAPPQVMRVMLLPYKGDGNELYMLRHVYFFVDEPRWVLGDSISAIEED